MTVAETLVFRLTTDSEDQIFHPDGTSSESNELLPGMLRALKIKQIKVDQIGKQYSSIRELASIESTVQATKSSAAGLARALFFEAL
jgi:hypothetical protein